MESTMRPVDPVLEIPDRYVGSNGSGITRPTALLVRRLIDPVSFWVVTAISLGVVSAAVALSGLADLPSAARATPPVTQFSIAYAVVPVASEPPVVLRGHAPPKATRV